MNRPDHETARARIRQLNAIPDRDRTDAEWDELNELEIMLAPGNREGAPDPSRMHNMMQNRGRGPGGNPGGGNPGGGQHRRNKKNFQHRRPKGPPQGSPGSQGGGGGGGGGGGNVG